MDFSWNFRSTPGLPATTQYCAVRESNYFCKRETKRRIRREDRGWATTAHRRKRNRLREPASRKLKKACTARLQPLWSECELVRSGARLPRTRGRAWRHLDGTRYGGRAPPPSFARAGRHRGRKLQHRFLRRASTFWQRLASRAPI
jgi:hypothetical protein